MKPILSKINVFSATEDAVFQFGAYADIDLVAFIVFKSSDSTVYKFGTVAPTGTGLARQFVIKANVLQNQHDPYYIMIRCRAPAAVIGKSIREVQTIETCPSF